MQQLWVTRGRGAAVGWVAAQAPVSALCMLAPQNTGACFSLALLLPRSTTPVWSAAAVIRPLRDSTSPCDQLRPQSGKSRARVAAKMAPKRGMSLEDKRSTLLDIFHSTKEVYVLKVPCCFTQPLRAGILH